jgi:hypothetical protein
MSASSSTALGLTLAAVMGMAVSAQDPWTVPPDESVLMNPEGATLAPMTDPLPTGSGMVVPHDGGYSVGDEGSPSESSMRFEQPPAMQNAVEDFNPDTAYGPVGCGSLGCGGQCEACCPGACPPAQPWCGVHDKQGICWVGRADALILWRSAPPDRPLVETGLGGVPVLNADGMDSPAAGGPRFSLFRFNRCNGTGIEATYLQAANWRSERPLSAQSQLYALAPPGIYGNGNTYNFDTGYANLGASVRSFELNRHWCKGEHLRFLAGFRWVEWQENFSLSDEFDATPVISDYYETDCINDLYGGQIGLDMWLLSLPWMRIDSVVKAGAYYNNAVQTSVYRSNVLGTTESQKVRAGESPLNCAFVGELGFTGVVPLCSWLDFRFGYFGLWLSGIAQPTQQLSGQVLTQPAGGTAPTVGSINADGGVLVQGASLGLEARW